MLTRLKAARWLANHGVMLTYSGPRGGAKRYVPPDGRLTVGEATRLLGLTHTRLDRLKAQGRLKLLAVGSVRMVTLREVRRVKAMLNGTAHT